MGAWSLHGEGVRGMTKCKECGHELRGVAAVAHLAKQGPVSASALQEFLGCTSGHAYNLLSKSAAEGVVVSSVRGSYVLPRRRS